MELMTFSQVAKILGMTVRDIERNVRAQRIPVVRIGRKRRIPDAWVFDPQGWMRGDYAS